MYFLALVLLRAYAFGNGRISIIINFFMNLTTNGGEDVEQLAESKQQVQ